MFAASLLEAVGVAVQFQEVNVYGKTVGLCCNLFVINGRGGGIRTPDPLLPKQMRYQAALRPDGLA